MATAWIDIICAAYNRGSAIRATIDSVRAQTMPDWSLIIVSDGSTDDTDDIVRTYRDPRIRLYRTEPHGHPGGPRNVGLAVATAPYVAYIDHDDRWLPEHLEVLADRLRSGAELVATGCVRVDEQGTEVERTGITDQVWHPELQTANAMFEPSRVAHRRDLVSQVGGWSTVAAGYEDWDLWFRLAQRGHDFHIAPERTAVQILSRESRRHRVRPRRAVRLGQVADEAAAISVLDRIVTPEVQADARRTFAGELADWYGILASDQRFHLSPGATLDEVRTHLRSEFSGRPCLLEQLAYARTGDTVALVLPVWCVTEEHLRSISMIITTRYPRQLKLLDDVTGDLG